MVPAIATMGALRSRLHGSWIAEFDALHGRHVATAALIACHNDARHALLVAHGLAITGIGQQDRRGPEFRIELTPAERNLIAIHARDLDSHAESGLLMSFGCLAPPAAAN